MIKKTIKYTDIDGITREEEFYFNFTQAEILELQVSRAGGYRESIEAIVAAQDPKEILAIMKEVILKAYGERSGTTRQFTKTPELAEGFSHTEAYSNLFMELFTNEDLAIAFFNGLLPESMKRTKEETRESIARTKEELLAKPQDHKSPQEVKIVELPSTEVNVNPSGEPHQFTLEELRELTPEQFAELKTKGIAL